MSYAQLFYHMVWATKNRAPLISTEIEPVIYAYVARKVIALGGKVFALNGMQDHTHLVSSIPSRIAVATFIGQVKSVSSAQLNSSAIAADHFAWQEEYGVFSFDGKRLPQYIAYVEKQKEHHGANTIIPILERYESDRAGDVHESQTEYSIEGDIDLQSDFFLTDVVPKGG